MSGDDQHTILSMGESQSEVAATPPKKPISLLGRVLIGLLWCLLIETFLGLWAVQAGGFVPSSLGNDSVLVSLLVGAISGAVLALRADEKRVTKLWMKDPFIRSLALGCVGAVFVACACVGLLWSYTALFGVEGARTVTVSYWRPGGARSCQGPELVEAPILASVCLGHSWKAKLPPGTRLTLIGHQTIVGLNTENVRLAPQPPLEGKLDPDLLGGVYLHPSVSK